MFVEYGKVELLNVLVKLSNAQLTFRSCPEKKRWLVLDGTQVTLANSLGITPVGFRGQAVPSPNSGPAPQLQ